MPLYQIGEVSVTQLTTKHLRYLTFQASSTLNSPKNITYFSSLAIDSDFTHWGLSQLTDATLPVWWGLEKAGHDDNVSEKV